jgi:hypothetical protein
MKRMKIRKLVPVILALLLATIGVASAQSAGHSVMLSWTASTSAAGCVSPCTFGYNVYRGTTAGGENLSTPLNGSTPITALTFQDTSVAVGTSSVTYFYVIEAVETSGGVTLASANSNEVSATFPALPAAPVLGSPKIN